MTAAISADASAVLAQHRPKMILVAYRMLGSVSDAEDVVQEAFIRWMKADRRDIVAPEGFLCRIVTRLCLDHMKSVRRKRETYIGPWLPEPVVEDVQEDDITLPLMLALERLSPLERAAFLLHDVFGLGFDEVSAAIGRDVVACRQLATRARVHVREARPRFQLEKSRGLELANAFFVALRSGDMTGLRALLSEDVSLHADGGGKRPAVNELLVGQAAVLGAYERVSAWLRENVPTLLRVAFVNGLPGLVTLESDGELQTTALGVEEGKITAIYVMRNPEKLKHLLLA